MEQRAYDAEVSVSELGTDSDHQRHQQQQTGSCYVCSHWGITASLSDRHAGAIGHCPEVSLHLLDPRSKNNAELLPPREKQNMKNKENTTRKYLISSLEQ